MAFDRPLALLSLLLLPAALAAYVLLRRRRARYAVLTPAGTALIRKIFPQHAVAVERALGGLTLAEQREATQLLRKLGLAAAAGEADE